MELQRLNAVTFEEFIYDNGEKCLVAFSRENCPVCRQVLPLVTKMADRYAGRFGFYQVDVEKEVDLYRRFPLQGVPSLLFFGDGEYLGKLAGNLGEAAVIGKIESILR